MVAAVVVLYRRLHPAVVQAWEERGAKASVSGWRTRLTKISVVALFVAALGGGVGINALSTQGNLLTYYGGGPPPVGTPGPPTTVNAFARCSGTFVTWHAPVSEGASPITGYIIWIRTGNQVVTTQFVGPTPTSAFVSGLANGTHYSVTVGAVNAQGQGLESAPPVVVTPVCVPTTLTYTGDTFVMSGNPLGVSGLLGSPNPACVGTQTVSFALDANPVTGAFGNFPLGTAVTANNGQTPTFFVPTPGWKSGVYGLTASFAGTELCAPAQDLSAVVVGSLSDQAAGGGWINDNGRANFGFTVHSVSKTTNDFKGQLLFINKNKWRLKGDLTSFSKDANGVGTSSGTGDLYFMNGNGGWQLAQLGVTFTIKFTAPGKKKSQPATFGIVINYTPTPPQPASPNTAPMVLKGGSINMK